MTKNNNSKKTFWDYWSTSHLVFGALAALITAITGLFAAGILKPPNFSQQQESPIVKTPPISTPEKKQVDTVLPQENSQNSSAKTTVKAEVAGCKGVVESCK